MSNSAMKTLILLISFLVIGYYNTVHAALLDIVWSNTVLSSTYWQPTEGATLTWTMTINDTYDNISYTEGGTRWHFLEPGNMEMGFEAKVTLGSVLSDSFTFSPVHPISGIVTFHQPEFTSDDWKMSMNMDWYSMTGDHHTVTASTHAEVHTYWYLNDWRLPDDGWAGGIGSMPRIYAHQPSVPIPEPATMVLFGAGLVSLIGSRLEKKKKLYH